MEYLVLTFRFLVFMALLPLVGAMTILIWVFGGWTRGDDMPNPIMWLFEKLMQVY